MVGDGEKWVMWQLECCRYVFKKRHKKSACCLHLNASLFLLFDPSLFIYSTTIIAITSILVVMYITFTSI